MIRKHLLAAAMLGALASATALPADGIGSFAPAAEQSGDLQAQGMAALKTFWSAIVTGTTQALDPVLAPEYQIERADGSQLRFLVDRVATFPSDAFPTEEVYGATTQAALRLITCGGKFNAGRGRYSANVVAFASFTP